ncbi:TonB-dependent receptor [Myroides odoratimimus]|uniref:SusC/RagA family TonB-linked outer membrane protein n=1 Tax=Myroides odoratimimus TaxID=76832 RepID=A0AAI8C508_9FLAO|nr:MULTISPECIES: TonB-dependent receptor [Myroides]ALU26244.1 SusC/RagA family TonB-linked outer membrane protein [Myroides odoratimimus]APA92296.1 SusC/RagA family TonB-linked outer membrane protein [Myroides sp. ZB35]MDM1034944.1 TonB-dependent receptor [Myroides odoratimimus]MDM1038246.1 TonB-dependent receptor [Myroides odoratimimus]MDM1052450.1 TonB-dependent receptor [Myroides odoratimimus]
MKSIKLRLLVSSLLLLCNVALAQQVTVTGVVREQGGFSLPGVSVIVKNSTKGVQTDLDGKYTIDVNEGDVLQFEYVGFKPQSITVTKQRVVNISLAEDVIGLDDIVIVAYGAQKQKAVVGAISQIKSDALDKQVSTSVVSALQGTVAGVNIINSNSQPGESPTIRIRGIGSINASADPLIILDGAPYSGYISSISADQIESINVLKDASSTALYGSRGANGVILIKTKMGKLNSQPDVNIKLSSGVAFDAVKTHKVLDTRGYTQYLWEARKNNYQYVLGQDEETARRTASDGLVSYFGYNPFGTDQPVDYNGNWTVKNPLLWETDWKKELQRNQAFRNEYNFNVAGGGDRTTYFLSGNYLNQDGMIKTSNFERTTVRLNIESQVTDWLQLGANTAYSASNQNFPVQSGTNLYSPMGWIYAMPSVYPVYKRDLNGQVVYDAQGSLIYDYGNASSKDINSVRPIMSGENAAGILQNNSTVIRRSTTSWNGFAKLDLAEGLYFRTNLSYEKYDYDNKEYNNSQYGQASSVNGRVLRFKDTSETLNFINALHYDKTLGEHHIAVDGIYEAYKFKKDFFNASTTGFLPGNTEIGSGTSLEGINGYDVEDRLTSYLGRVSYDYANKYFIEGSFRRDASTRFDKSVRKGNFYSVGGSWIVSSEDFLVDNNTIDLLKLRVSYGELGNNNITGKYFPYLRLFDTGYNQLDNPGVVLGDLADPYLTWEKTASFNAGIDFSLFNNRIEGSVDYYKKRSIDLLFAIPQAPSTGNLEILSNAGTIENYGLEVSLTSHNIRSGDWKWDTSLNFSIDRNKIKSLTQDSFISGLNRWAEGRSLYDFYLRDWAGVDSNDGYGMWYKDVVDTDGQVIGRETTKDYNEATRYYNKSALPKLVGGFNTALSYKNFDFSAFFNFSLGGYIYDNDYSGLMNGMSIGYQSSPDIVNRWQKPGDITDIPVLINSTNNFAATSTRFLYKNDYLRLKALTLGYTLPIESLGKFKLKQARVYVQGENLLTFQSHKGIDPEQAINGVTNYRVPLSATLSVGLNINF